jgi:hypothetical protein
MPASDRSKIRETRFVLAWIFLRKSAAGDDTGMLTVHAGTGKMIWAIWRINDG